MIPVCDLYNSCSFTSSTYLLTFQTITKDGKSFTECWKRAVCVDGLYKYKSNTGLKEYMTKNGYPELIINNMDDFKMALKATDEGLTVWESWGEVCNTFSCKFDEETTYKMPFEGMPDSKVVVTHNGTGNYKDTKIDKLA